jgi:hypothetical protein
MIKISHPVSPVTSFRKIFFFALTDFTGIHFCRILQAQDECFWAGYRATAWHNLIVWDGANAFRPGANRRIGRSQGEGEQTGNCRGIKNMNRKLPA